MNNFCAVFSLSVALCLIVCVSATPEVTAENAARAAVEQAKQSVTEVRSRAQRQLDSAKGLLDKMELYKNQATQASSHAATTATGNTEAESIAQQIKRLSDAVDTSYSGEKGKLVTAVSTLTSLLQEAQGLDDGSNIEIKAKEGTPEDFTEANQKAKDVKGKATELDGKITAAEALFTGVDTTVGSMAEKAKEAQLKDSHVSAIVAVAKINSMLGNANNIIGQIEGKKNAVSVIVDEMNTLKTNPPTVPGDNIKTLLESAGDALTAATGALDNANNAKAAIQTQKGIANAALTNVKGEKQEVSDAQKDANTAEACVATVQQSFSQLQSELQIADNSLTSANNLKQQLQTALSPATSAKRPEQSLINPELKQLQDSVSATVNRIKTIMEEADGTLQETKNNKEAVHNIVEEMKKLTTTEFIEANENIKMLYSKADDALTAATGAVQKAEKAKTDRTEQKQKADAALSRVATAKDVETAQKEVNTVNECVNQANQIAAILKSALKTAKDSVTSVTDLKKKLEKALSTTPSAPTPEEVKETEKANPPVEQRTEPDQKDTTMQPTSKELPSQSNNSTEKQKDALINSVQNVPTTALTGGKAPAPGAKNDSAMTVSVPLLVALIASAVLQ